MTTASASVFPILKSCEGFVSANADTYKEEKDSLTKCANTYFHQGRYYKHWKTFDEPNVIVYQLDGYYFVIDTDDEESNIFVSKIMEKHGVVDNMTPSLSNHLLGKKTKNHYWFKLPSDIPWTCKTKYVKGGFECLESRLDLLGSRNRIIFENKDCCHMLKNIPIMSHEILNDLKEYVPSALLGQELNFAKATKTKKKEAPMMNEIVHIDDNECPEDIKKYIEQTFSVEDSTAQDTFFYNGASLLRKYGDEQGGLGHKAVHYFAKMAGKDVYNKDSVNMWLRGTKVDRMSPTYGILKLKGGKCLLDVEEALSAASTAVNSVVNSDEEVECVAVVVEQEIIAMSEEEVAKKAFDKLKTTFMSINKQLYGKWGNIWCCSDVAQWDALLCGAIVALKIKKRVIKEHKFGEQVVDIVWCDTISHLTAVHKRVKQMVIANPRDDMYDLFHSSTLGKLCFEDGVYEFTTNKFLKWDSKELTQSPVYSCVKIPRKFPSYKDEVNDWAEDLKKARLVFHAAMGEEQADKFLAYLARVTAGKIEDKVFSCCMFNRDCSKGVINDWFIAAFGNYVGQADGNALVFRDALGDSEKENGWMIPLQYCRHVFISELEVDPKNPRRKINSKLVKSMCSGGDPMKARLMRENGVTFRLQCGVNIMANDLMPFSSPDVLEKCLMLKSVIQFKTKEYIDAELERCKDSPMLHASLKERLKVADQTIRTKVKTNEWADALVRIMIHHYSENPVVINSKEEKGEDDECEALDKKVVTRFNFTGLDTDRVTNENLRAFATLNNTSLLKLKATIMGVDKRVKDYKSGSVKGMKGILEILPSAVEEK
jgi:hypothetical protein